MNPVSIADRAIGPASPPYVIAELSANHNGDLRRAFSIMEAAHAAGADSEGRARDLGLAGGAPSVRPRPGRCGRRRKRGRAHPGQLPRTGRTRDRTTRLDPTVPRRNRPLPPGVIGARPQGRLVPPRGRSPNRLTVRLCSTAEHGSVATAVASSATPCPRGDANHPPCGSRGNGLLRPTAGFQPNPSE